MHARSSAEWMFALTIVVVGLVLWGNARLSGFSDLAEALVKDAARAIGVDV